MLHGLGDALFYRHGQNSWSPCGWRRLSEEPLRIASPQRRLTADDTVWDDPSRHHSSAVAALQGPDGQVLLLGSLGLGTPRLAADLDTLVGWCEEDGAIPGSSPMAPRRRCSPGTPEQLAARLGSSDRRAGNVWCTWYAYYESITEDVLTKDIDGTARAAVRRRADRRRVAADGRGLGAQLEVSVRVAGVDRPDHDGWDAFGVVDCAVHRAADFGCCARASGLCVAGCRWFAGGCREQLGYWLLGVGSSRILVCRSTCRR